jgi:hypothetical protein
MLYSFVTTREITHVTAQKNTERWVRKSISESNSPDTKQSFLQPWFPDEGRVPHISLVFREMWDTADVDR